MKKFVGILLSVCLMLGLMAIPAAAADGFDWQVQVTFDEEAGTATFTYTPPENAQWVEMFLLTEKPENEGFGDIWNVYGDSLVNGRVKRGGSDMNSTSRTVGALGKAELVDEFEFVPGQTYYTYLATPIRGGNWEISKCFEFTYPGEKTEKSDLQLYVECDTENMTASIHFEELPTNGGWPEMGIYTEPQVGWNQDSEGILNRLGNVVPANLWRVGPSSMTDENGLVDGERVLESHFEFTVGETYYIYICYRDASAGTWNVVPGYYEFVFEDGHEDGTVFDADQLVMLSDLNKAIISVSAGAGQNIETKFDAYNGNKGDYRDSFDLAVKKKASSLVFDITNYAGEVSFGFQGYRWNGGGVDQANANYYFTGEAQDCDGIYLVSWDGTAQRAEVEYISSRYQVIIPEGFDGYLCVPITRIGNSNSETLTGNFDHSNDEFLLYWEPGVFVGNRTENAAVITLNGFGSLFYKVGESSPVEPGDNPVEKIEALIAQLPNSINATNYTAAKTTLDAINEILTAHPELKADYGDVYEAMLAEYNVMAPIIEEFNDTFAELAEIEMNEENEADWQESIKELYALLDTVKKEGHDVTGLIEKVDEFAADFEAAYGYAWNTDKPDDNNGDFATLAFVLAAVAGSGVIAVRRKKR